MRRHEQRFYLDADRLQAASAVIRRELGPLPATAIILGSGLGAFATQLQQATVLDVQRIPGYPPSTIQGHQGRWVIGTCAGIPVLALQGRVHAYEGHGHNVVAFPTHLMAEGGVRNLIITNAAGGINRFYAPGDFMVIDDHINLTFDNPLFGPNQPEKGSRFPDMSAPYDRELIDLALEAGRLNEPPLHVHRGVYLGIMGPSYETAAEIRMAARLGADAVGMSTVPEVIAAVYHGLRVLGISCITNLATGLQATPLTHDEVTEVGARIKGQFISFLIAILKRIHS